SSLLGKALRRPDQVQKVLDSVKREGFWQTYHKVQQKLDVTRALGYSCSGVVLETRCCDHVHAGDRVACAGTDAATHGELNFVPRNLCVPLPENVTFEEGTFAAMGAIALHAAHLGVPLVGENVAVLGLGPLGLLLAQILRAAGCRVAGFDLRTDRLALAQELGIERCARADASSLPETLRTWLMAQGFDAVYIAAAARSAEPAEMAVAASRDRGKIIVVGDVQTNFPRNACYLKELNILYARSYGPGRYDVQYEEAGVDYPRAHVPWTEGRNLAAFLELVAQKQVRVAPLITHRFVIEEAERAYEVMAGDEPSLGVVLLYPSGEHAPVLEVKARPMRAQGKVRVGFIGAGNYAKAYLLPALQQSAGVELCSVSSAHGISAKTTAEKFGFARCATDPAEILRDPDVNTVFIATRHDSHADLVVAAIEAGKAVFVEKPLCLREEDLKRIEDAYRVNPVALFVGHNRRFAPVTEELRKFFGIARGRRGAPLSIRYIVHAGPLPAGHWLHDPAQGGRILGEVCHFVDWCNALTSAPIEKLVATLQGEAPNQNLHAVLNYRDGSVASVIYLTDAHHSLPKELIEVSGGGQSAQLENFAECVFLSPEGRRKAQYRGKGQTEMVAAFLKSVETGEPAVPFETWAASAQTTLQLLDSASTCLPIWF
ncbi:MAG: bi-domain-containing oxidoreductase, partial [Acidobacteria bacterium]|nr:bi-domain-containing oxidoreductase [Acidobacteriota bacterium]